MKRLAKISNHAYKNSEKNQIIFIDNQVHKPTIHRISANTPQKNYIEYIYNNIEENFVLRTKEREEAI